jgi:hypothetical protein
MSRPESKKSPRNASKKVSKVAVARSRERRSVNGENPKLAALLRKHFAKKGRAARIARAHEALRVIDEVASTFKLDEETLKWIAEDPDLEHL